VIERKAIFNGRKVNRFKMTDSRNLATLIVSLFFNESCQLFGVAKGVVSVEWRLVYLSDLPWISVRMKRNPIDKIKMDRHLVKHALNGSLKKHKNKY